MAESEPLPPPPYTPKPQNTTYLSAPGAVHPFPPKKADVHSYQPLPSQPQQFPPQQFPPQQFPPQQFPPQQFPPQQFPPQQFPPQQFPPQQFPPQQFPPQQFPPQQFPPQQFPPQQFPPQQFPPQQQSSTQAVVHAQPTAAGTHHFGTKPQNYLALSIFSCICCCWLCGLIAIFYSTQVDSSWSAGDYEGAKRNSQTALHWNVASIMGGIIVIVLAVILNVVPLLSS